MRLEANRGRIDVLPGEVMGSIMPLVLYGASGYTLAMKHVLQHAFAPALAGYAFAFIDDFIGGRGETLDGLPVLSLQQCRDQCADVPYIIGIGAPGARARLAEKIAAVGGRILSFYGERPASLFPGVEIGLGCFIGPNTYVGSKTIIGAHTQIMSNCSIGHDVTIGSFCTVSPSCTISGYVELEEGVLLGAGTTIVNGTATSPLRIGRGAKLWAGSVVTRSIPSGAIFAGNPAVSLRDLARARRPGGSAVVSRVSRVEGSLATPAIRSV